MSNGPYRSPDGAERNPGRSTSLMPLPDFTSFHPGYEERTKERKRNAGRRTVVSPAPAGAVAPRIRSACADPSAVGRARLPAFHHGSCQGEYLIPKARPGPGFVGQACQRGGGHSADTAPTSSDAPRTPVVMPAGMMPEPPGSAADEATPAGTALAPLRPASPGRRPFRARFDFGTCGSDRTPPLSSSSRASWDGTTEGWGVTHPRPSQCGAHEPQTGHSAGRAFWPGAARERG